MSGNILVPDSRPQLGMASRSRLLDLATSVDHKKIGIMYMTAALVFFVVAGIQALLMRLQLSAPRLVLLTPNGYNQLFMMHGTTMVFFFGMPILAGAMNYLVPLQIGARDVAFPRLNAFGFWIFVFSGLLLYASFFVAGGAPAAGWFSYAPLSEKPFVLNDGQDYWTLSLLTAGIGSVVSSINLIVTIVMLRAPGLTLRRLPLFTWMALIVSFLTVLAVPVLNAALIGLAVDRSWAGIFSGPKAAARRCCGSIFFGRSAIPKCITWLSRPLGSFPT